MRWMRNCFGVQLHDALAGVETCAGPVASGALVDTGTAGAQSFAVTATDLAGNTTTVTHFYSVDQALEPADLSLWQSVSNQAPVVGSQMWVSLQVGNSRPGGGERGGGVAPAGCGAGDRLGGGQSGHEL
jgi:hypothetical protein